ncbi:MAG: CopG family transcriptional regulator [Cyanobacteria bacterium P01_A01_bin.17]
MSSFQLKLQGDLLESTQALADGSGVSLEQWLLAAVEAKVEIEALQCLFDKRAQNADYMRFDKVLSRVPEAAPAEGDEL